MRRYFIKRVSLLVPTLWGAVTVVFFFIHLLPGDPVEVMLGETASSADKEFLRRQLGLDQPLWRQYFAFLGGFVRGDLGWSIYEPTGVLDLVLARFPATIELALAAMLIALVIGLPLGILAAAKKQSWIDQLSLIFSLLSFSMPNFWLGPLLIVVFSIHLGWLPVSGRGGISHLILPALTQGSAFAAIIMRIVRSTLLSVIHENYIQVARAKGLREREIWLRHALRNCLVPVITILGLQFGGLLAGSIITETIFAWPGIGRLTLQAIQTRDYPLVQGCLLTIAISYLIVNFMADVLYVLVNPRIRHET